MEPIWIEREDGQEMVVPKVVPKSPILRKQMVILAEQVRDAIRNQPSETALDVEGGR